ncbi:phosphoesterase [Polaribacter reichenbachii]|uniref:Phosphoesterase n=1 Tax=Polaribacter reichenbachii TaxID=996801 RepID=A0A1B8TVU5_9FLAO|nr:phosphatase PAP2 family protein [Polaribacter reichenbachii]APZ45307.1 phosphoesterase [Polaribacter reichenbachii]AUC19169.1 phosphoesterase [Polaribacter reichenbachii]OBY63674.1 phosphoesterase [Polaribacter reichenbachii]
MMKRFFLFLLITLSINSFSQTQKVSFNLDAERNLWQKFSYDLGNIAGGMGYAYSRPLYWQKQQFANLGYVAAGTSAFYFIDDNVDRWAVKNRTNIPNWLVNYGNNIGDPNNNYRLTGAIYLAGLFSKSPKLRRTGVLLISSASAAGLLQQVSKRIIGRARPRIDVGKATFDPFHIDRVYNYDSFPSGHVMLGFTNAYVIAKQFKSPWIKAGLYTIGSIPGLSRILDRFHWISDVAFSTAISIFIVEAIDRFLDTKYDDKYNEIKKDKKVAWNLQFAPGTLGVTMNF